MEQKRERSLKLISKDKLCKQGQLPSSDKRQFGPRLAPMDDIPSVTALFQDAAKGQSVLGMTCLHRGLAPMDDIPSVTALHQDEDAAKGRLGPENDLPT